MPSLADLPKDQRELAERLQAALGAGFAVEGVLGSGGFAVAVNAASWHPDRVDRVVLVLVRP